MLSRSRVRMLAVSHFHPDVVEDVKERREEDVPEDDCEGFDEGVEDEVSRAHSGLLGHSSTRTET